MGKVIIPEIKKILYATDLSASARYAFAYAVSLANRYEAGITILHALDDVSAGTASLVASFFDKDEWEKLRKGSLQKVIDTVKTRLEKFRQDMGEEWSSHPFVVDEIMVERGNPVEVILAQIEGGAFDLVIMGSHGHGTFADAMMGSTARRVLRRSPKPVMVVRLPDGNS